MTRGVDEPLLERMEERLTANPALMQARTPLVEHPLGTINHANEPGYGLMTRLKHGRAAFSLSCVADTRTRLINSLGIPRRLVALG